MSSIESPGHERWLKTLTEARENCREKLATAMVEVADPSQAIWPSVPRRAMMAEQRAAMHAHVSIIDYADLLEPCQDQAKQMWEAELEKVQIGGDEEKVISLANLDEWESQTIRVTERTHDELYGERSVTETRRILLPVVASRECYRQMNRIVQTIGLGINTGEIDGTSNQPF